MFIYFDKEVSSPAFGLTQSNKIQRNLQYSEMIPYNAIQLLGNLRKGLIQIECFYRNLIAAHMIDMIGHHVAISFRIEQHSRNLVPCSGNLGVFVLHIREDLIQVAGMKGLYVKMGLQYPMMSV